MSTPTSLQQARLQWQNSKKGVRNRPSFSHLCTSACIKFPISQSKQVTWPDLESELKSTRELQGKVINWRLFMQFIYQSSYLPYLSVTTVITPLGTHTSSQELCRQSSSQLYMVNSQLRGYVSLRVTQLGNGRTGVQKHVSDSELMAVPCLCSSILKILPFLRIFFICSTNIVLLCLHYAKCRGCKDDLN